MTEHNQIPLSRIIELIVWCVAAPVLTVWALVSLLPMVGVIGAWGDAGETLVALAFLCTSAVGLAAAAVGYRLLLWERTPAPVVSSATRTRRAVGLSAYALVWMALYAL